MKILENIKAITVEQWQTNNKVNHKQACKMLGYHHTYWPRLKDKWIIEDGTEIIVFGVDRYFKNRRRNTRSEN